jgi:Rrf2 family protein
MKLSTRIRYGLRLLVGFAVRYKEGFVQLNEVTRAEGISEKYSEQIVRILRTTGILVSHRGAQGGYRLAYQPDKITVLDVIEALEGKFYITGCLKEANCKRISNCVARDVWKKLQDAIVSTLNSITLADLAKDYREKRASNITYEI